METLLQQTNPNTPAVSNKPVRVLHVVEASVGGIKTYLLQLINGTQHKFQVEVACPRYRKNAFHDTDFTEQLEKMGVVWHEVPMVRNISPLNELISFVRLYQTIKRGNYDIVHTHSSKAGFLGRIAARLAQTPVIIHTPNAYIFTGMKPTLSAKFYGLLEKVAGLFGDKIICVSESEKAEALRFNVAPAHKLVVVKNAISPDFMLMSHQPTAIKDKNKIILGAVGRLTNQKGFEYLIKAVPFISHAYPHVEVWLIGDGELRQPLGKLAAALNVTAQIKFLGFRADVPQLISEFDLVVMPSLYEGLPFWLLEAMLAAKPVVATDALGINDVLTAHYNGLLVPPRDSLALGQAICSLLSDPTLAQKLGNQARQTVLEEYSLERMIAETVRVYLELVKQKEGRLVKI